ncbi:hypothetical protein GLOTRDRAFT_112461 [Gloeophyllum trabeum ATCC 11539]|uniref:Uncharacterized protein n=1 Tax=Gloeophyllum trabeum (strain ATCC 11539 / FP-39264 / Madison 617) TaxID=670483 RepID=S7PV18_GLOTA|nr:uncharacterized protein GLOTRDRAFT_112461 [Gloeophyllum trabeum ATCC 11539]EPQ51207.1 hypothetical protein GLOTRDRAFT_112461 [Gloeophyllum trabeum ATCC 11539]
MSIRDVFSGRQSLNMGDEDDWVDEDDDTSPFMGGLGQMPTSTSGPLQSQAAETFTLSAPPRFTNASHGTAKRSARSAASTGRRSKSSHSPVGRSSPLPTETTFEEPRATSRRQLPTGRSVSAGYRAPAIQEEDEDEGEQD